MEKNFAKRMLVATMLSSWLVAPMPLAGAVEPVTVHFDNSTDKTISGQVFSDIKYTGDGGAIYNTANLLVKDSVFKNNTASSWSGAIESTTPTEIRFSNVDFIGNSAGIAGAVTLGKKTLSAIVENSLFEGNVANEIGAFALFSGGSITNTTFRNNKSIFYDNENITSAVAKNIDGGGALFLGAEAKAVVSGAQSVENSVFENNSSVINGGAIATRRWNVADNSGAKLDIIKTLFKGNSAGTTGGAIDNYFYGSVNKSDAVYISDSVFDSNSAANGGAIYNHGEKDSAGNSASMYITSTEFLNNMSKSGSGGAIYNTGKIELEGVSLKENTATGWGGAIYNVSNGSLTIKNSQFVDNKSGIGGAVVSGTLTEKTTIENSLFEGNQANEIGAVGLFAEGTVKNTIFRNNKATFYDNENIADAVDNNIDGGGALFLGAVSSTNVLASQSVENSVFENNSSVINGGAIATRRWNAGNNSAAKLDIIKTLFKGNKAGTTGGAIDNYFYGSTTKDGSVFVSDSLFDANSAANGGAIYNHGELDKGNNFASMYITNTQFTNNSATENGGAIYNAGTLTLDSTKGNVLFENNTSNGVANDIYMAGDNAALNISGTNIDNAVVSNGGISGEVGKGIITVNTDGSFVLNGDNSAYTGMFTQVKGNTFVYNKFFEGNNTVSGGKITFGNGGVSTNITIGNGAEVIFTDGSSSELGKVLTMETGSKLTFDDALNLAFYSDIESATDGAGDIYKLSAGIVNMHGNYDEYKGNVHIEDGDFNFVGGSNFGGTISAKVEEGETATINNLSQEKDMTVGSIEKTGTGTLTITNNSADDSKLTFEDVVTIGENNVSGNLTSGGVVEVNAPNVVFDKTVSVSGENSELHVNGGATFNDNVLVNKGTLGLYCDSVLQDLTIGSTLTTMNGDINTVTANNLTLTNDTNLAIDADPRGRQYDKIEVTDTFTSNGNDFVISDVNFTTIPEDEVIELDIISATNGSEDINIVGETAVDTLMGTYSITGNGQSVMASLTSINPQMYRGQVATVASYANQLVVNNSLFNHVDLITMQMLANNKANIYASSNPLFAPYQYSAKDGGLWYKSYVNLERISMTQGISVGNNAYGSLIGADFPLITLDNGWKLIPTAYVGYNGAHQTYNGVSMFQNGGQAGVMGTLYKDDFITSLLTYVGGYGNSMNVGDVRDNTGNWFAGVASKSAYNIHLPADFILQPTALLSYNIFGSQSYNSAFGNLAMGSGTLNGLNIAPGLNLIWNKDTFSVYAMTQMVFNIMGTANGHAGNVQLNDVEMRHSFFEYGLGVTKKFKDKFSSFFQVTLRNGGRTGVGFQGGLQVKL